MIRKQPFGLMDYLLLSEEERDFYILTGRFPSERTDDVKIEVVRPKPPINKGGRPRKTYHINERRAYCLWLIAKEMSEDQRAKITNRKRQSADEEPDHNPEERETQMLEQREVFETCSGYFNQPSPDGLRRGKPDRLHLPAFVWLDVQRAFGRHRNP